MKVSRSALSYQIRLTSVASISVTLTVTTQNGSRQTLLDKCKLVEAVWQLPASCIIHVFPHVTLYYANSGSIFQPDNYLHMQ